MAKRRWLRQHWLLQLPQSALLGQVTRKDPEPVETMDLEIPASPRREQRRLLDEASEALALKHSSQGCCMSGTS